MALSRYLSINLDDNRATFLNWIEFLNLLCIIFVVYHKCLFLPQRWRESHEQKYTSKVPAFASNRVESFQHILVRPGREKNFPVCGADSCLTRALSSDKFSENSGLEKYVETFNVKYCCWASYGKKKKIIIKTNLILKGKLNIDFFQLHRA